jgi:hypothetical protein
MANVKGAAVTARLRYVRERHGEDGLRRLFDALPAGARAALEGEVLPDAWLSFDVFVEVNVAVDRLFGKGDLALCFELGRYAAEVNLPTLFRFFYRFGSPVYIFRRAAQLWSLHYDSGRLAAMEAGSNRFRLEILDFERPHRVLCQSVLGWACRSCELSGGVVLATEEARCRVRGDETCELLVTWG